MNRIILEKLEAGSHRVDFYFRTEGRVGKYVKPGHHLFLEYDRNISDVPHSILAIPFAANLAPLAWLTGSVLQVEELDAAFHDSLVRIKAAYQAMYPHFRFKGAVVAAKTVTHEFIPRHEAAQLFSGGLDALTTYIRIRKKKPYLVTEYGWHEDTLQRSEVWEADKANAVAFARDNGLENILVQSNYGTFLQTDEIDRDFAKKLKDSWWHGLHHGLAIISAAIPPAFGLKVKCLYIASSNSPLYKVTCASDPTVDNEIRYGSGSVFHDAFELNRQEKIRTVIDYYKAVGKPAAIRVCFRNAENCCSCEKCMRTLLAIVAEGEDPRCFGFPIPENLSAHVKNFLDREIKFFVPAFIIIYWKVIQRRMAENHDKILFPELRDWFLEYDFLTQRKKALLHYRVTNFLPIVKRKIRGRLYRVLAKFQGGKQVSA